MKKGIKILSLLFTLLFALPISVSAKSQPATSAQAAIVMVAETGDVLYEKNAHKQMSMASTTKIMTSLIALEAGIPNFEITVSENMLKVEGTSMGLLPEDKVTVETLVYGMLLASGNDAANVIALTLANDITSFSALMNKRAKEIGMNETNFVTPSGLDDENHYSTAYDMALLGCEAIKNPEFLYICSQENARVEYGNPPYFRTLRNHNRLLQSCFGTIGIKTGYTKKSGRCLVSAAERDGITLVAVTLNAPNDWSDHQRLYDYSFDFVKSYELDSNLSNCFLKVIGGEKKLCALQCAEIPSIVSKDFENSAIERVIRLKPFEYAPIEQGDVLGWIEYFKSEKKVCEVPIISAENISSITVVIDDKKSDKTLRERIKSLGCIVWQKIKSGYRNILPNAELPQDVKRKS